MGGKNLGFRPHEYGEDVGVEVATGYIFNKVDHGWKGMIECGP